jgi:DNA-binding LytR/AlgR family response regulator
MKLRCAIVDDDALAITILEGLLKRIPSVELVATFEDVMQVYEFLCNNQVDFIFLDVEMPNLSGIDFLKSLSHPPLAIITSANKHYAIEGFELNVVDYVLKPIGMERVLRAINKIIDLKLVKPQPVSTEHNPYIYLKENKRNVRINLNEILYLESIKDYVKVVTAERIVTTMQSISYFEEILDPNSFIRVHRSFIVAIKHIQAFSCSVIETGNIEINIGRQYKDETLKRLGEI